MVDYNELKSFNKNRKKEILKQKEEEQRKFNKINNIIQPKIEELISSYIISVYFDKYIENYIKNHIKNVSFVADRYNIPFEISYELDLDLCRFNIEGFSYDDVFDEEEDYNENDAHYSLIPEKICNNNDFDNVDLFEYYFHIDNCKTLNSFSNYFKETILTGLKNNKITVNSVGKVTENWVYDHVCNYTAHFNITVDLS